MEVIVVDGTSILRLALACSLVLGPLWAQRADAQTARPNDIAVVVDVSGSMRESGIIAEVRSYLDAEVVKSLVRVGDRFTLIAFGSGARTAIRKDIASEADIAALSKEIAALRATDEYTDLGAALEAFDAALESRSDGAYRPVALFITDGKNAPPPGSSYAGKDLSVDERFRDTGKRIAMKGWKLFVVGLGSQTDAPAVAAAVEGSTLVTAPVNGPSSGGGTSGSSGAGTAGAGGSGVAAALGGEQLDAYLADTEKTAANAAAAADAAGAAGGAGAGDGSGAAGSGGLPVWLVGVIVLAVAAGGAFVVVFLRSRKSKDDEQAPKA
jgi:hypothetical protein